MADPRQQDDAKTPPRTDDPKKTEQRPDHDQAKRRHQPSNGDVDEGLDETFPASDPPAPSRPTGAK